MFIQLIFYKYTARKYRNSKTPNQWNRQSGNFASDKSKTQDSEHNQDRQIKSIRILKAQITINKFSKLRFKGVTKEIRFLNRKLTKSHSKIRIRKSECLRKPIQNVDKFTKLYFLSKIPNVYNYTFVNY